MFWGKSCSVKIRDKRCQVVNSNVLKFVSAGYNEGWLATGNYMWRLTLDFFETVRATDSQNLHSIVYKVELLFLSCEITSAGES